MVGIGILFSSHGFSFSLPAESTQIVDMFYSEFNNKDYNAMLELQEAGSPVNMEDFVIPTLDIFNNLLKTFSFDGDRRTIDLYKHIKKLCRELFKPNIQTYNAIIATEIKLGDVARAKKILREIRSRGLIPTITTFNQLFIGYYKTDWEQHMKEFREKERTS